MKLIAMAAALVVMVHGRRDFTEEKRFYWTESDLQDIPTDISSDAQEVHLYYNRIREVPSQVFHHLQICTELYLQNNLIETLQPGAFLGLQSLKKLRLDENKLAVLPKDIFSGLKALKELDVSNCILQTMETGAFNSLVSLEELYLHSNQISHLQLGLFAQLARCTLLDLKHNMIVEIQANALLGLDSLVTLLLQDNNLTHLDSEMFEGLTSLQVLDVSQNHIAMIYEGTFEDLPRIHSLILHSNGLITLPSDWLKGMARPMSLGLSDPISNEDEWWWCESLCWLKNDDVTWVSDVYGNQFEPECKEGDWATIDCQRQASKSTIQSKTSVRWGETVIKFYRMQVQ